MLQISSWGVLDIIDFLKDLYYVVTYPHQSYLITILFWISLLFTIVYSIIKVAFMNKSEYIKEYGLKDFKDKEPD